ncbi:methyltransferase domain-containing protein [Pseudoroseomonas globiformis]|uniref:Methyltransferase domain-containing protein n=1 Tax=Teichococcus globiformis TaxID=2307229 RepID=A0ABV7FYN9_9PROT
MPRSAILGRLRHAASIALGRHLWRPPAQSSRAGHPAEDGFLCVIDRFSLAQGRLRLAGWTHHPGKTLARMTLRLPGGAAHPVAATGLPSPDLVPRLGAGAGRARFDETLSLSGSVGEVADAVLMLRFADGSERGVTGLGAAEDDPAKALTPRFAAMLKEQGPGQLLEVGSRARSGNVNRHLVPEGWGYTGMDVLAGPNVDVVGDAHRLSTLFPERRFDGVMAFSVLEHILMPWRFAVELNKVMNLGGVALFTTHQSWPMHDQPWDFWRYSNTSWAALFNHATGFEVVAAGLGERVFLTAERLHPVTAFTDTDLHSGWGMSAVLIRKTGETALEWPVEPEDVIQSSYPA